ncbi:MAG: arylsulfatase, partial [Planctomycetota bacterium]
MRRTTLVLFGLSLLASVVQAKSPNVVLVITDDQGYGDLSCHGNPILKTPQLDRVHDESIRLTDYHVSPTCSPTRAALLTGHWTNRTGVWHTIMGRSMLRDNEVTIADVFQASGYATGMFGKWHLGDNFPYRPQDRGFDEVLCHGGGGVGQTPDHWDNSYFDGSYFHNGVPTPVKGFCTDVFFNAAKDFIKRCKEEDKPFFTYLATNAPHGPMHSPESFSEPYQDESVNLANFYGMIANIDMNVGRLRKFLDEQELTNDTIFIFTTDNGSSSGWKTFNSGMRAGKGSAYDGGHRVPFFMRWPGGGLADAKDVKHLTAHVDVLPTLIELCDLQAPEGVRFDGQSLVPLLRGNDDNWPDRILVTDSQRVKDPIKWRQSSVMTSQWRMINGKELYDMTSDHAQANDVSDRYPDVMARLRGFYEDWWADLEPSFSQSTRIQLGHPKAPEVRLTSHDWITTKMTPWNQSQVRAAMTGEDKTGFWYLNVATPGKYTVRLRRWPREADTAIDAPLPAGDPVPGARAYRSTPGAKVDAALATLRFGDQVLEKAVEPGSKEVLFELELPAGETTMAARFVTESGKTF